MSYKFGIYGYHKDGEIVYIGKDKEIDLNTRHKQHTKPSTIDEQWINTAIAYEGLEYIVIVGDILNEDIMNDIETDLITRWEPKYNIRIPGMEVQRKEEYEQWKKENLKDRD